MIPVLTLSLGVAAAPIEPVVRGAAAEQAIHVILGDEGQRESNCNDAGLGTDARPDGIWSCTPVEEEAATVAVGILADGVFLSVGTVEIPDGGGRMGLWASEKGVDVQWEPTWEGAPTKTGRGPGITWIGRITDVTSEAAPVMALSGQTGGSAGVGRWRSEAWCRDDGEQLDQEINDGSHICVGVLPPGAGTKIRIGRRAESAATGAKEHPQGDRLPEFPDPGWKTGEDHPFGILQYDADQALRFATLSGPDPSQTTADRFPLPVARVEVAEVEHDMPTGDGSELSLASSEPPDDSESLLITAFLLGIIILGCGFWWKLKVGSASRTPDKPQRRPAHGRAPQSAIGTVPLGWRGSLAVFAGLFGLGLGAVELWAQGQEPQLPSWVGPGGDAALMTGHPTRLWGMTPGNKQNGPSATAFINELGLRGALPPIPRPEGRHRILALGDSAFFGHGVEDDEVFTTQLQAFFQDRGMDVDVINGAVAGYSVAQHQILMDEDGWDLDPTLIIFSNVWSDNTWDSFHDEDLLKSRRFADLNPLTRSAFVKLLAVWMTDFSSPNDGRIITWSNEEGWPEDKVRRVPLRRWAVIHDELMRQASARGIGSVMLLPTNTFLISQEENLGEPPPWTPYFRAAEQLSGHHKVPVLKVGTGFDDAIADGLTSEDLFIDLMHPTPRGHRIMAEALGEALIALGWPDSPFHAQGDPFDSTVLQDVPSPGWFDDEGVGSPQVNLFRINAVNEEEIASQAEEMLTEKPPAPRGLDEGPLGPTPAWILDVTVQGGTPPIHVVVEDDGQRPVGRATMMRPGQFQISMHMGVDQITVRAEDGSGRSAAVVGGQDANQLTLGWPE